MLATKLKEEACDECGAEELYFSTREDGSIIKVYLKCDSCGRDYGRIGTIKDKNSNISQKAEKKARRFAS